MSLSLIKNFQDQQGHYINEDLQRVGRLLEDIDPTLHIVWIEPAQRTTLEDHKYPYAIICTPDNGDSYIYKHLAQEDLNSTLIANILLDRKNSANLVDVIEAQDLANKLLQERENMEKFEEAHDKMAFWMNQPKHRVQLGKGVYRDV